MYGRQEVTKSESDWPFSALSREVTMTTPIFQNIYVAV